MSRSGVVDLTGGSDSNDEPHLRRYPRTEQLPSPFIEASRRVLGAKIVDLTAEDEEEFGLPSYIPTGSRPRISDRLPTREVQETPQEDRQRKERPSPVSVARSTPHYKPDISGEPLEDQSSTLASRVQNTFTPINKPAVVRPRSVPETPPFINESKPNEAHLESNIDGDRASNASDPQQREFNEPNEQPGYPQFESVNTLQHLSTSQDDQVQVDAIPLSLEAFQESLKKALCHLREDHQYYVKVMAFFH